MSLKKKLIIAAAVVVLLAGGLTGVFFILRANREPAKVYPVAQLASQEDYWYDNYVGGEVRTDRLQTVYVSDTQEVVEIFVSEGDTVQKGDPLLQYNTTLTELQLQRKDIDIQKLEQDLSKAQKEYKKLFGSNYVLPTQMVAEGSSLLKEQKTAASLAWEGPEGVSLVLLGGPAPRLDPVETEPVETEPLETEPVETEPVETEPVETEPAETEPVETEPVETEPVETEPVETEPIETEPQETEPEPEDPTVTEYRLVGGTGTQEDPYLVVVAEDYRVDETLIRELLGTAPEASVVFAQTEENQADGIVTAAWGMQLTAEEAGKWSFGLEDASFYVGMPLLPVEPEPEPEPEPDPYYPPVDPGYTREELAKMRKELEQKIYQLDLSIRMARVEYAAMEREIDDGMVYAELDGVVMNLTDPEYAVETNEPLMKISGGGGYTIVANVSELQLEQIEIGRKVSVNSWYGGVYEGTVEAVSPYPVSGDYGDPNASISYYPISIVVDASADMGDGYWVDVDLGSFSENAGGFYLTKAFVLNENGKSYVYVRGEKGRLEKRYITTGRDLYGYMIQVLDGLSMEDYIAFPYAKTTEEGAKTVEGDLQSLYGY